MRLPAAFVPLVLSLLLVPSLYGQDAVEPRVIVLDVADGNPELDAAIHQGGFFRWMIRRSENLTVREVPKPGEPTVRVEPWPLSGSTQARLASLPIVLTADALRLGETTYRDSRQSFAFRLDGGGWLVTGFRTDTIAELADRILISEARDDSRRGDSTFDFLVFENPWLERRGRWKPVDSASEDEPTLVRLTIDPEHDDDGIGRRDRRFASYKTVETTETKTEASGRSIALRVPEGNVTDPAWRLLAWRLEAAVAEMAAKVPIELETPISVAVEPDFPTQGRHTGEIGAAVLGGPADIHLVADPRDDFVFRFALAQVLMDRAGVSVPDRPWLARGAALWLSDDWFGRSYTAWLPTLAAARVLPSPEEILATTEQGDASEPLWTPVAAEIVGRMPGQTLGEKLSRIPGTPAVRAILTGIEKTADRATKPNGRPLSSGFQRGVSLAMLNSLDGGYHAPSVDRQLARLKGISSDAVSIMPFAYQPRPNQPEMRFLNRHPSSETDVGSIHAARQAHAAGFDVLWKPHLWISWNSWPGEVEMETAEDWATWWRSYRRYILHHALLAEWSESEMLSIGVELGRTLNQKDGWLELIEGVRYLFGGAVTYSGNWYGDAEHVPFWDRLDVVGVDAYFPLSVAEKDTESGVVDDVILAKGAEQVAKRLEALAEKADRPVVLTEVGFPARRDAWRDPHAEGGEFSTEHQARAYRALLNALVDQPWLRGVYLWKAFSDQPRRPADRPDFSFLGRPAEAEVQAFFEAVGKGEQKPRNARLGGASAIGDAGGAER